MAIGTIAIQAFIEGHHKRCVAALQRIALLADTGSKEHQAKFCPNGIGDGIANGWRVAEAMREVANDAVGILPVSEAGRYESEGHRDRCALVGFLVMRVLNMRDSSPAEVEEHVLKLLVCNRAIEAVTYIEKAMRKLQADHPDTPITWRDMAGGTRHQTIEDWVSWHIQGMRDASEVCNG